MVIAKSKQYARQERKRLGKLDPNGPLCDAARPMIDSMLGTVWHYLPLAAEQPGDDVEHVHQLRVATRRAGAALSIFQVTW